MDTTLHRNSLLALLPEAERQTLRAQQDIVSLHAYDELSPVDGCITSVNVPLTLVGSILHEVGNRTEVDCTTAVDADMLGSIIVLNCPIC